MKLLTNLTRREERLLRLLERVVIAINNAYPEACSGDKALLDAMRVVRKSPVHLHQWPNYNGIVPPCHCGKAPDCPQYALNPQTGERCGIAVGTEKPPGWKGVA